MWTLYILTERGFNVTDEKLLKWGKRKTRSSLDTKLQQNSQEDDLLTPRYFPPAQREKALKTRNSIKKRRKSCKIAFKFEIFSNFRFFFTKSLNWRNNYRLRNATILIAFCGKFGKNWNKHFQRAILHYRAIFSWRNLNIEWIIFLSFMTYGRKIILKSTWVDQLEGTLRMANCGKWWNYYNDRHTCLIVTHGSFMSIWGSA